MKIYDFDAKFYDYVRVQMAMQPKLREDEIEAKYNEMMRSWLNAPAQWLDGAKPAEYFNRYDDPRDLMKLLEEYLKRDIGLPEPLYSRIVEMGEDCVGALTRIAGNAQAKESLRATAMALLRDIGSDAPVELYIDMVCSCEAANELNEMACENLKALKLDVEDRLMSRYDGANPYARMMILDLCVNGPGGKRVYDKLVEALMRDAERRGYYAVLLGDLGDERAIEPLRAVSQLSDLSYLDYIEVREAIEQLGGDPGEPRDFNGDPAYEALRNL